MSTSQSKKEMDENLKFFEENLDKWLNDLAYKHKYVVIANKELQGVYDDFPKALDFATSNFVAGEFIIQHVIGDDEQIGFLKMAL